MRIHNTAINSVLKWTSLYYIYSMVANLDIHGSALNFVAGFCYELGICWEPDSGAEKTLKEGEFLQFRGEHPSTSLRFFKLLYTTVDYYFFAGMRHSCPRNKIQIYF
jgi:hypothetical protein